MKTFFVTVRTDTDRFPQSKTGKSKIAKAVRSCSFQKHNFLRKLLFTEHSLR